MDKSHPDKLTSNVIAIDGPSGSGKSTVAKKIAQLLNISYLDTGAMYRALSLFLDQSLADVDLLTVPLEGEILTRLKETLRHCELTYAFNNGQVLVKVGHEDYSSLIRNEKVAALTSRLSSLAFVRDYLKEIQRTLVKSQMAVLEGRDIGTVVFPDAKLKIFLVASVHARSLRRFQELKLQGLNVTIQEITCEMELRDARDSNRLEAPLKKAHDAIEIDTSNLSIDEVVNEIISYYKKISLNQTKA